LGCATDTSKKEVLTQLYTPRFGPPPPAEPILDTLQKTAARWASALPAAVVPGFRRDAWLPDQAGVLWLSMAVALLLAFDFRRLGNPRNLDLLLLQVLGWCFLDILSFLDRLRDPTSYRLMDWMFTAIVAITVVLLVRAIVRARRAPAPCRLFVARRAAPILALVLVGSNVAAALSSPPDDAGYFINIGGQRLRERIRLPYGDPLLTGTPAAAYGPVLYAAHIPFQIALAPEPVNAVSPPRPRIEAGEPYYLPPLLATKLATAAFHLVGIASLFFAATAISGRGAGWTAVALYSGSAFVLGVGGAEYSIGGMTFTSHIAPAAVSLLAFALLRWPQWAGAALAASVGALFYPIFMVPAWIGYYSTDRQKLVRFVGGFGITALLIGGSVLALSAPASGRSLVGTILYDTIGHQESPEAYGSSPFGFWGQRGGVRGWLMSPLAGTDPMTRPVVLAFFVFAAAMLFTARGRTPAQFALIVAAVAMGAQLWKIHATATYVTWYYPFLLLGLLCDDAGSESRLHA
jgi:hypothetical protein